MFRAFILVYANLILIIEFMIVKILRQTGKD